jgi:hypothetical protein
MIDAFKIGVHLSMTDGVSGALGVLAREMLGFNRHLDAAQGKVAALRTALVGLGAVAVGGAMVVGMGAIVKAGAELVNQQAMLKAAGENNKTIADATARAFQTAQLVPGTTASGNLRALGELRGLLGSVGEASALLPRFQEFGRVLGIVTGKGDERTAGLAAQFLDQRGAIRYNNGVLDEARFTSEMDALQRAVISNRNRVSPQELLNFMQTAGPSGALLNQQSLYSDLSTLIESMRGFRAGTALAAASRMLVSGVMPQRNAAILEGLGLLEGGAKPARRRARRGGGYEVAPAGEVILSGGGVRGADVFQRSPVQWMDQYLLPALRKAGANNEEQQITAIQKVFSTETARRFFTQLLLSRTQIDRERGMQAAVAPDAAQILLRENYDAAAEALSASVKNLGEALGSPLVPLAARAMNALASGINSLAVVASRNPGAVRTIGLIAAGLGGALVVIGALAIGAAAVAAIGGGSVAAAIVAIGAGLGALAAGIVALYQFDWSGIGRFFGIWASTLWQTLFIGPYNWLQGKVTSINWSLIWSDMVSGLSQAATWLKERTDALVAIITSWSPTLGAAIEGFRTKAREMISAIVEWVVGIPGRVAAALTNPGGANTLGETPEEKRERYRSGGGMNGSRRLDGFPAFTDPDTTAKPSSFVPTPGAPPAVQPVVLMMDGREIGRGVIPWIGREAAGPIQAPVRFDNMRALAPAEMT